MRLQCVYVFDDARVVFAAEDQPDAGAVARPLIWVVQGAGVEVHPAGVLGLEWARPEAALMVSALACLISTARNARARLALPLARQD
jgi:hypothetical protein